MIEYGHEDGTKEFEKKKAFGTCQQDPVRTNDRKEKENFQAKTWEVEGRCPGLRAFRLNEDGRGGASNAMASTGAEAGAVMAELRGSAAA